MKNWCLPTIKSVALTGYLACIGLAGYSHADEGYLPYYDSAVFTPHWLQPNAPALADFHTIPDFSFTNQYGETVTQASVAGKLYVASFFFTTCPGICPAIRSKLEAVYHAYQHDDDVLILSHSIRPSTDTVATLKAYADQHGIDGGQWQLLTGDQQQIYSLAKSAYFASEDLGNIQNTDDFLHTENLLLIDSQRRIRGIYNGLSRSSVDYLIQDIAQLKQETPQ